MKITREQFNTLMNAAVKAGDSGGVSMIADAAALAGLAAIGITVEESCLNCEPLIAGVSATRVDGSEGFIPCNTCNAYVRNVEDVSDECLCSRDVREYCHSSKCHGGANFRIDHVWIERAWRDVREGDVIRPPGLAGHEAEAVTIGATQHWHVAPDANQYRPNESPMEWASIPVTLRKLGTGEGYAPPNGMNPNAAVEIRVTRGELAAIEACGGWQSRVKVINNEEGTSRG